AALGLNDGTDRLLNMEKMEFGNGEQLWITAQAATGNLTIDNPSPAVGDVLRVNLTNLQDGNGIAAAAVITLTWQALIAGEWQNQGVGTEFTVVDAVLGAPLRVVASFTDRMGDAETLTSGQTSAVLPKDQATTGAPLINDLTPTESLMLTAVVSGIADADGLTGGNFSYQWQMSTVNGFVDILGATSATFTPGQSVVGSQLQVVVTVVDDEGNAPVVLTSAPTQPVGDLLVGNNLANTLTGTAWSDILRGEGSNDVLNGLAGDDLLVGGAGNDTLNGGDGQDTLQGDAGNDRLDGGLGADAMAGGSGDDTYLVDHVGDLVTEALNGGTDVVQTTLGSYVLTDNVEQLVFSGLGDFSGTGNGLANTLTGGAGNDALFGLGGNDRLLGGNGNDLLDGGDGVDNLQGGSGNDTLVGGAGADTLLGGAGDDILVGSAGNDLMDGNAGSDIFQFGAGFGRDTIAGFDSNPVGRQDYLDISLLGINAGNFASSVGIAFNGGDALINIGSNSITLVGVNSTTISIDDFILEIPAPPVINTSGTTLI
ncbi:MAG: calcium-binding protein, partial [Plesiomonas shigelloides]